MKKTFLILAFVVAVIAIAFPFLKKYTKSHSPLLEASCQKNGLDVKVSYCSPTAKGRLLFGEKGAGALQPYGQYWRVGANEATTFETATNLLINGKELKAGKYALYAIPGAANWTIAFNSNWDRWGATAPAVETDVLRTEVPVGVATPPKESLEIAFSDPDAAGSVRMDLRWDKTQVSVPLQKK